MVRVFSLPLSVTLLGVALLGLYAAPVCAQTYITTDTTLDASSALTSDIIVGHDSTGTVNTSPTLDILGSYTGVPYVAGYNSSLVRLNGGRGNDVYFYDTSTFNMTSGFVNNHIYSDDNSTINLSGGVLGLDLDAHGSSHVSFSGGSIGQQLVAYDNSVYRISGGSVARSGIFTGNSAAFISGGTFGQDNGFNLFLKDNSALTLIGSDLTITDLGPDAGFGEMFALGGRLLDGTDLTNYRLLEETGSTGSVTLTNVPEPGSVALVAGLSLTGMTFLRRRKRAGRTA